MATCPNITQDCQDFFQLFNGDLEFDLNCDLKGHFLKWDPPSLITEMKSADNFMFKYDLNYF